MREQSTTYSLRNRACIGAAILVGWLGLATPAIADMTLVMVEERGCVWCARWNADVATEYPITPEGRAAPLRRIDINAPMPADLALASDPVFTPTFILVEDGTEVGRMEGYPGEEFFWGLLGRLLDSADAEWAAEVTH